MTEVDPDDWQYEGPPRIRPNPGNRLAALRRSFYDESVAARKSRGRQVCITTYVLAQDRSTIETSCGELLVYARHMGWRTARRHFTDVLRDTPAGDTQPSLSDAVRYVGCGYAHGILMLGRSSIASIDDEYEALLHWLHIRCSFIAFIPPAFISRLGRGPRMTPGVAPHPRAGFTPTT
ncbi:hypothetical protein [Streptomyces sp. NPDC048473]|uniref:hypothetical protein n=1 Tax=Streptomyces sp. NPDC048473 TaxID=3365556 RepID=UPI00371A1E0D